jgi:hypothetical protein
MPLIAYLDIFLGNKGRTDVMRLNDGMYTIDHNHPFLSESATGAC